MRIDVFSIFPEYLEQPLTVSLVGRAREAGLLDVRLHDPREHATGVHRPVDDAPFGGGAGMVMMPEPLFAAVEAVQPPRPLLLLSAGGERFDQARARDLAEAGGFSLLCGRYEGVDQRVADYCCDGELSVGDYVLAGGEAAALVVIEAVTRLVPGVMGNDGSGIEESFGEESMVEYPQYTRPARYRDWEVPEVLRSGDHARVARWRRAQSLRRTMERRPDLIARELTAEEEQLLAEFPPGEFPADEGGR
jgi:tRNA (guanine37-N1)-methyltransferase